jgi:hypothetical protein
MSHPHHLLDEHRRMTVRSPGDAGRDAECDYDNSDNNHSRGEDLRVPPKNRTPLCAANLALEGVLRIERNPEIAPEVNVREKCV